MGAGTEACPQCICSGPHDPPVLVHLIGLGEVVARLGRSVTDRLDRAVIQAGDGITDGNQAVLFTRQGFYSLMPLRQGLQWTTSCTQPQSRFWTIRFWTLKSVVEPNAARGCVS